MYATDTPFHVDPEPERRADVAHPARAHLRGTDREVVVAGVVEANVARELSGSIGKNGGRIMLREDLAERPFGLARAVHVDGRALAVQRREERQALHVIPVQVRQQHRTVELALVAQPVRTQPGTEVEHDRREPSASTATHEEFPP